jgi:hypothetical protein
MAMMLKSLGIDPDEIKGSIDQFMQTMKAAAEKINANQLSIEAKLDMIQAKLNELQTIIDDPGHTAQIKANGEDTGILITTERFPKEMIDDVMGPEASEVTR